MFYSTKNLASAKALFPSRNNHPAFEPIGETRKITPEQQRFNLFADMAEMRRKREFNESVRARGGRVLPALYP
jgi:hypothetical protein